MKQNFLNSIKVSAPKKSAFDLSHDVKLSCNMGELIPTLAMECIPGDKFHISNESLLRFQPLIAPMMHRVNVYMHYFFVPNRILWSNWETWVTNGGNNPGTLPVFPTVYAGNDGGTSATYTTLMDYMGVPNPLPTPSAANVERISAFPFAAYTKIWNEYYRDQNLQPEKVCDLVDGDNTFLINLEGINRCWEHDYFTAALPWAQRGEAVAIPFGDFADAPVKYKKATGDATTNAAWNATLSPTGTSSVDAPAGIPANSVGSSDLYVDNSDITADAPSINDLRTATKLQEWLEKAARAGARYVENIFAFFNVKSQDSRLQRPEYITGSVSPVVISEVLNTTGTTDAPQGNMSGHGIAVTSGNGGSYECKEHGYIIGILSIMPKTAYQQGVPKHFLKVTDPMELAWPQFAHLGEQAITQNEVYAYTSNKHDTFGYIPKYGEYKFMQNRVCGYFRTSLNTWHMGRIFETEPALNGNFISSDPTDRIFAVIGSDEQRMLMQIYHKITAIRPLPKFGTPTF